MTALSPERDLHHYSHKADFAQNLMSVICGEHRLDTRCRDTLDFHYDGMRLPHRQMAIGTIRYGAQVTINIANLRAYSISLPLHGRQQLSMSGASFHSNDRQGLIVSNASSQDLIIHPECQKIQVVIPEKSMQMVLSDLLDQPVDQPIIFDPQMHVDSSALIAAWWKNIEQFMQLKSQYSCFYGLQMLSEDYENFVIKSLLLSQENNFSALLKQRSQQEIPAYIMKLRQFMIEHAHEMLSAEDLLRCSGVSKSKLYAEFQQYYATTPMLFLRNYRLQQIYKILSNRRLNQRYSISRLAYDWGFTHLSRFSQEYREAFGETPSETKSKFL